jgi:multidrug efflux pump
VLAHRRTTLLATLATVAFTALLALVVPKGFFPVEDTGMMVGISEAAPDISFARMLERQEALASVLIADPDVATVASFIGADGTNITTNSGRFSIALKPRDQRHDDATTIIRRLMHKAADVHGITLYLQPVQDLTVENRLSRTQYQYTLEDADPVELAAFAPKLVTELRKEGKLRDVASDQENAGLQVALAIDRDTASRLGVSPQAIDEVLYDAFGQRQVSIIFTQLNLYRVILELKPEIADSPAALDKLFVRSVSGVYDTGFDIFR